MSIFGGGGGGQSAPPLPPAAAPVPTLLDPAVRRARDDQRAFAAGMSGRQGTIVTGGQGLPPVSTTGLKTLLGQ